MTMIKYAIEIDDKVRFGAAGHAPQQEPGWNVVCGLVSMLANVAAVGCSENSDFYKEFSYGNGQLEFECDRNDRTVAIVRAVEAGLVDLTEKFPECFE